MGVTSGVEFTVFGLKITPGDDLGVIFGVLSDALFGLIPGSTFATVRVVRRPQKKIIVGT